MEKNLFLLFFSFLTIQEPVAIIFKANITISNLFLFLLGIYSIVLAISKKKTIKIDNIDYYVFLFCIVSVISFLLSDIKIYLLKDVLQIIYIFFVWFICKFWLSELYQQLDRLILGVIIISVIPIILGLFQIFSCSRLDYLGFLNFYRPYGLSHQPNSFAYIIGSVFIFSFMLKVNKVQKYLLFIIRIICFYLLFFTLSRSASISLFLVIGFGLFLRLMKIKEIIYPFFVSIFLIVFTVLFFDRDVPFKSLIYISTRNITESKKFSNNQRFEIIKAAIKMFKEKPVVGYGPGAFQFKCHEYASKSLLESYKNDSYDSKIRIDTPHNFLIQLIVEEGMLGLAFFLLFIFLYFKKIVKQFAVMDIKQKILFTNVIYILCYSVFSTIFIRGISELFIFSMVFSYYGEIRET